MFEDHLISPFTTILVNHSGLKLTIFDVGARRSEMLNLRDTLQHFLDSLLGFLIGHWAILLFVWKVEFTALHFISPIPA